MAIVLTCYYLPKPGGLCKRLFQAIDALLNAGHEVHYLALAPFPIRNDRCHFHRFPWPPAKARGLWFWLTFHIASPLFLLYLGFRYRVSHAFAFSPTYGFLLQPLRLVKGIPLTVFARGDALAAHRQNGRSELLIFFERGVEALGIAGTRFFGISGTLTRTILNRHRIVFPKVSGVLPNNLEPRASDVLSKSSNTLRFACVGTLESGKNHALVLHALKFTPQVDGHLYIFGNGTLEAELKSLTAKCDLCSKVTFMGWVDHAEIWKSVDVLMFPSSHEGCPNAVLEAIGHDVAVLASDIPELREILPEEFLVKSMTVTAWSSALVSIAEDPSILRQIAVRQRAYAQRLEFNWKQAIAETIVA